MPKARSRFDVQPYVSLAGNLVSGKAEKQHGWTGRAGAWAVWDWSPRVTKRIDRKTKQLWLSGSGKYYRSQDNRIRYWAGEVILTPKVGRFALGVRRGHETIRHDAASKKWAGLDVYGCCLLPKNHISWQSDLDLYAQFGRLLRNSRRENKIDGKDMHHVGARASGRIYFDWFAREVLGRGWKSSLYPFLEVSGGLYYARYRDSRQREFISVELKYPLNDLIGIDLTYHRGAKGDVLDHEESLILSLDVRI